MDGDSVDISVFSGELFGGNMGYSGRSCGFAELDSWNNGMVLQMSTLECDSLMN